MTVFARFLASALVRRGLPSFDAATLFAALLVADEAAGSSGEVALALFPSASFEEGAEGWLVALPDGSSLALDGLAVLVESPDGEEDERVAGWFVSPEGEDDDLVRSAVEEATGDSAAEVVARFLAACDANEEEPFCFSSGGDGGWAEWFAWVGAVGLPEEGLGEEPCLIRFSDGSALAWPEATVGADVREAADERAVDWRARFLDFAVELEGSDEEFERGLSGLVAEFLGEDLPATFPALVAFVREAVELERSLGGDPSVLERALARLLEEEGTLG